MADEKNEQEIPGQASVVYQGPSPDEIALLDFAKKHGFEFIYGSDEMQEVRLKHKEVGDGGDEKWTLK